MKAHTRCLTKILKKRYQTKKEESTPGVEPLTSFPEGIQSTVKPLVSLHEIPQIDINIFVRTHTWETLTKKRKHHPSYRDDASTAEAESGETSTVRNIEQTAPSGRPHLELIEHLRLKTWCKSDFSIAETTWPTYLYIHLYWLDWRRLATTL